MDAIKVRGAFRASVFVLTFLATSLFTVAANAAIERCDAEGQPPLPPVFPLMGTNGASNELVWVRPDVPDVCITSQNIQERAQLGSLVYNTCKVADEPGFVVVTTDVNRGEVLYYQGGVGGPEPICDSGSPECAIRPNHVAIDKEGLLAVADTTSPSRIGFFEPTGDCSAPFGDGKFTGPLVFGNGNSQIVINEIVDLEFSDQIGGNFEDNDLLVLSGSPKMLLLIKGDGPAPDKPNDPVSISAFLDGSREPTVQVLLNTDEFEAAFGVSAVPTAITVAPGSGGLGQKFEEGSRSPVVLLGMRNPDQIVELRFDDSGSNTICSGGYQPGCDGVFADASEFRPDRLDAGVIEGETLLVVASGNGKFTQIPLSVDRQSESDGGVISAGAVEDVVAIADGVQNPGGAEYFDDVTKAQLCVDGDPAEDDTGCSFGFTELHFSQFLGGGADDTDTVGLEGPFFHIESELDTDSEGRFLLPADEDNEGRQAVVPSWCRGFPLLDDTQNRRVFIEFRINTGGFDVEPGETMQVKEEIDTLFPEFESCASIFGRITYIEDVIDLADYPEAADVFANENILRNISFRCNRGRGAGPAASTVLYCQDDLKVLVESGRLKRRDLRNFIYPEIEARLANYEAFVEDLSDLPVLQSDLTTIVGLARDAALNNRPEFLLAASYMDVAAEMIYENKIALAAGGSYNRYGVLLTESLATAFFFAQTLTPAADLADATDGVTETYCPPEVLITPWPNDATTEIRDVNCSNQLPAPPGY
jgi:hypothetical protein